MRSYNLEGVIINRRNVGEADKIITLFSLQNGKVFLKAKGIRKLSSKRAGSLELFNLVKTSIVVGRGNVDVITEVSVIETFSSWKKHLGRINIAYQLSEIIDHLTPENQPHEQVYRTLVNSFRAIDSLADNWHSETENWYLDILKGLGYWPENEQFTGNIFEYIQGLTDRPLHANKVLHKLK